MTTRTDAAANDLGQISRLRGTIFEKVTIAASGVGIVALVALLVFIAVDAIQPTTAESSWYLLFGGAFVVPTVVATAYGWRRPTVGRVGLQSVGATMGGLSLATLLALWLGGQLGFVTLVAVVVPTVAYAAFLRTRRDAFSTGLQTAGVLVAGGTVAAFGWLFLGSQAALAYAIALGIPAVGVIRFFLARPAIGSVGAPATVAAVLAAGITAILVEAAKSLFGVSPGETLLAVYALGAVAGVVAYALYARAYRAEGLVGLFTPFLFLAGALAGYLFHREFVVTAPTTPILFAVLAGAPALAFAYRRYGDDYRGTAGVVLPFVPIVGGIIGLAFHDRFLLQGPTVLAIFAGTIALAYGGYAWYVFDRDLSGRIGLLAPAIVFGSLLLVVAGERFLGIAGPEAWLSVDFLLQASHYEAQLTGINPALIGSLYLMFIVAFASFPVGVGAAIYLEEYAPNNRWARLLEINISNLAGVPSVVYGLLGVAVFVRYGGLSLGALVVGGFTLSLLVLPIVIISAQEAIRAVPDSLRQASYGMGATRWETIRNVVLPRALPGILTGTILALGRAVGETAPLIMVGFATVGGVPESLTDVGLAMPLQVFSWARDSKMLFRVNVAAAGALTLLIVMLAMNAVAIIIRNKYQQNA